MPVMKGKLKPKDDRRLTVNYSMLLENIDAEYFLPDLFSRRVFTADDKEEISSQLSKSKRTGLMLDKLLDSGPGEAYNIFIEILSREYPEVAVQVNNTNVDDVADEIKKPDYSWLESIPDLVKEHIITDADASRLSRSFLPNWHHVLTLLGLSDSLIDLERHNQPHNSIPNVITTLLIKWRQRFYKKATIEALLRVLQEVDETQACSVDWECVRYALHKIQPNSNIS